IRSGVLRFQIVGMDQTEYHVPCLFLGDPNSRPSVNAPTGVVPRKLLQPLQLLDVLRFEMKKEPAAGLAYGMMVVEKVEEWKLDLRPGVAAMHQGWGEAVGPATERNPGFLG